MKYLAGFLLAFIVTCWGMMAFGAAGGVDIDALSENLSQLISLLMPYLPESWGGWITLVVTVCAVLDAVIPRPKAGANPVWRITYAIMNALGCNVGRAKNASAMNDVLGKGLKGLRR